MLFQNDLTLSGLEITLSCQTSSIKKNLKYFLNKQIRFGNLLNSFSNSHGLLQNGEV